ncbi:MAG: dihydropteroate synthase, partial [bacterium]
MPTYSFRKLHLTTRHDILAEFGAAITELPEDLISSLQNHSYLFKVLARPAEFPADLGAELKQLGIRFWPITSNTGYLFTDIKTLQGLAQSPQLNSPATRAFAGELGRFLQRQQREVFVLATKPQPLQIGSRTLIMGVLNCTPDSFYDGGRYYSPAAAIAHGQHLAEEGADMIDIGGESTRPQGVYGGGAEPVSAEEEKSRVLPVIEALSKSVNIPLSIDTYKAEVAAAAVQAGASLVNDISGFQFDPLMPATVAQLDVPVVIMHTKGSPADMQSNPTYENLLDELYLYFEEQIALARAAGITEDRLVIDPGLGFGKRVQDNYEILRRLPEFRGLGCPILVGPSRKSFVGKALNLPP